MNELDKLRLDIDEIDKELAILFNKRMMIVEKIKQYKKENNIAILDKAREEYLIKQNLKYINEEYQDLFIKVEKYYLDLSKEYQTK